MTDKPMDVERTFDQANLELAIHRAYQEKNGTCPGCSAIAEFVWPIIEPHLALREPGATNELGGQPRNEATTERRVGPSGAKNRPDVPHEVVVQKVMNAAIKGYETGFAAGAKSQEPGAEAAPPTPNVESLAQLAREICNRRGPETVAEQVERAIKLLSSRAAAGESTELTPQDVLDAAEVAGVTLTASVSHLAAPALMAAALNRRSAASQERSA